MSVWIPLVLVVGIAWWTNAGRRRQQDSQTAACGLISAIGSSEGATQLLKLLIQRRRPNFFNLCEFNPQTLQCTAAPSRIIEANFSFPSGHSSLACCGMTYMVWFLLGKVVSSPSLSMSSKRILAIASCLIPWTWAFFVGATRIIDYWHHPSDVVAGLLLGGICSTIAFHVWYPPACSKYAGIPWSSLALNDSTLGKFASFSD